MNAKPKVVLWYKIYCILMAVIYFTVSVIGVAVFIAGFLGKGDSETYFVSITYAVMGFILLIPFTLALFFPAKPWNWTYGIIMICIGMTSCCCLPITIPLLIFWIKPETKNYFGRK